MKNWPGIAQKAIKICEELNIQGIFDEHINKKQFKIIVRRACKKHNDDDLKAQISSYKKMSALKDEVQKGNSYFFNQTLQSARMLFRFRVELFESKLNFKNKPEYRSEKYMCDSCESTVDHHTHVLFCPAYSVLREGKSLNRDEDLSNYLQKVLDIRTNLRLNK